MIPLFKEKTKVDSPFFSTQYEVKLRELCDSLSDKGKEEKSKGVGDIDKTAVAAIFKKCGGVRVGRIELASRGAYTCYDIFPEDVGDRLKNKKGCEEALNRYFACTIELNTSEPGKQCFTLRIPHKKEDFGHVSIKPIVSHIIDTEETCLPIVLGEDNNGTMQVRRLESLPHLLIAGSTGSGKSSAIHAYIMSMLLTNTFNRVQFVMIDVKRVEFSLYKPLTNYLATPIVNDADEAVGVLEALCEEMDSRFKLLDRVGKTSIAEVVNNTVIDDDNNVDMPRIVVVIDEFADLVIQDKGSVQTSVARLAQKGRAAGIHLIVATQRPSTDVLPGSTKVNFENRICFKVSTAVDSRVVLGTSGAEFLRGRGECMLQDKTRYLAPFMERKECERIIKVLSDVKAPYTYRLKSAKDSSLSLPENTIDRHEVISGNAFVGIHGYYGDKNTKYDYINWSERSHMLALIEEAMRAGYTDERMIATRLDCGMIEAIEWKNKLRYLRVIHSNCGFSMPCPLNKWEDDSLHSKEVSHKYDVLTDDIKEVREKWTDEYSEYRDKNLLRKYNEFISIQIK